MKHKHRNRILGRTADRRTQLLQQLTGALLMHGSIETTEAKAKELRRFIEPLITEAKQELTLARRRRLQQKLLHKADLPRLLAVAEENKTRPGGYVRITHLPVQRLDAARMARVDIIDFKLAE